MSALAGDLVERCSGGGIVVLTGAGASTRSGIPDYRSPGRPVRAPLQHRDFVTNPAARARYWARSAIGWPTMARARPNPAHDGLAALEQRGRIAGLITQNVDGLHQAAGSRVVCELHGSVHRVVCLECGVRTDRDLVQARILDDNPQLAALAGTILAPEVGTDEVGSSRPRLLAPEVGTDEVGSSRPRLLADGDAELRVPDDFRAPVCDCGGVLKPDVVLFGDSVDRATVDRCYAWVDAARLLIVVGSSLAVFSGYRFVVRAAERGVPIAIINLGPTRGDGLARWRITDEAGVTIAALARDAGQ